MLLFLCALVFILVMLTIAYLIASKVNGTKAFVNPNKLRKELEEFKLNANQVKVPLRECKVVSNSHSEPILKSGSWRVQALDSLYGDGSSNTKQVNVNQSQIIFRITEGLVHYDYVSPVVLIDQITLLFKLDFQNETILYIDKTDKSKYYFDLEFLIQEHS